jgi:hypothetical protein
MGSKDPARERVQLPPRMKSDPRLRDQIASNTLSLAMMVMMDRSRKDSKGVPSLRRMLEPRKIQQEVETQPPRGIFNLRNDREASSVMEHRSMTRLFHVDVCVRNV